MSSADYGERGGTAASRATSAVHSPADQSHYPAAQPSSSLDDTDSSTWSSLQGPLTANTSSTNLSPANLSSLAAWSNVNNSSQFPKPDSLSPNLDLSTSDVLARNESLLRDAVFPEWRNDVVTADFESPEELQKKDPLGTQIWKLYSRTKSRLPNQERMENLTWRMMAMNLRRREQQQQQQQQAAYGDMIYSIGDFPSADTDAFFSVKQVPPKSDLGTSSAPSGIAQQLRRSVDHAAENEHSSDPMNLDDFIVPSSVASPAGITSPAPSESTAHSMSLPAPPIPIAARTKPQVNIPKNLPPSSLPQSTIATHRTSEFDYVQKRVRKTSIDERRGVSVERIPCLP